jgi:hypothetical protein
VGTDIRTGTTERGKRETHIQARRACRTGETGKHSTTQREAAESATRRDRGAGRCREERSSSARLAEVQREMREKKKELWYYTPSTTNGNSVVSE